MKSASTLLALFSLTTAVVLAAQTPPPTQQQTGSAGGRGASAGQAQTPPPQTPPAGRQGGGGGGGGGRGGVQVLTLFTTWTSGSVIPIKHTQAGEEVSPPLAWTEPPPTTQSFVLIVHDIDAVNADATTDTLHWLVWNIPGTSRGLPERVPQGSELPDGSRQIAVTGPNYRGPAAPATGPEHHYVFDLYALDAKIDVAAVGESVAKTRAAVMTAMAGHVRGKATLVGRFKYSDK